MFTRVPITFQEVGQKAHHKQVSKLWADNNKLPGRLFYDQQLPTPNFGLLAEFCQLNKTNPASATEIAEKTRVYGNAFLNSRKGGVLMFGVDSQRSQVKGIELHGDQARYKQAIERVLQEFSPLPKKNEHYKIHVIPIENNKGQLTNFHVIAIVFRPYFNKAKMDTFQLVWTTATGGECYMKSASDGLVYGPFSTEQAENFVNRKNEDLKKRVEPPAESSLLNKFAKAGKSIERKVRKGYKTLSESSTDSYSKPVDEPNQGQTQHAKKTKGKSTWLRMFTKLSPGAGSRKE